MTIQSSNKRAHRRWSISTLVGGAASLAGPIVSLALPHWKSTGDGLSIAGGALTVVGGICAWAFSERLSAELDRRLDDAEHKGAEAVVRADLLSRRAHQVEAALELERAARAALERHLAPRTVSADQLSVICNELAGPSDAALVWITTTGDPEVKDFAEAIRSAMAAAGIRAQLSLSVAVAPGSPTTGVDAMIVSAAGKRIADALLKAEVIEPTQVRMRGEPNGAPIASRSLGSTFPEETVLRIRVLPKDPHIQPSIS